jgi:hypothetical protein
VGVVFHTMNLRSGNQVGAGILQTAHRGAFEEGVTILLSRWTALQLAVENQWGGRDSAEKAEDARDEILEWFYKRKGSLSVSSFTCVRFLAMIARCLVLAAMGAPAAQAVHYHSNDVQSTTLMNSNPLWRR